LRVEGVTSMSSCSSSSSLNGSTTKLPPAPRPPPSSSLSSPALSAPEAPEAAPEAGSSPAVSGFRVYSLLHFYTYPPFVLWHVDCSSHDFGFRD